MQAESGEVVVRYLVLLFSVLLPGVTACAGNSETGGSGGDATTEGTGFLVGPSVSGVSYETPTRGGVTGVDGSFRYEDGEVVRFTLGDTLLGEVTGKDEVTVFDLAGSPVITGTRELQDAVECAGFSRGLPEGLSADEGSARCRLRLGSVENGAALSRVLNRAVLLQSLDHDGDTENGIEIRADVAALFAGVNLDLDQPWRVLRKTFAFRHVLGQANTLGLFEKVHQPVNPAPALRHVYDALEIDPEIAGDTAREARADGMTYKTEGRDYDAHGNVIRRQWDDDADGTPDRSSVAEYDAAENLTRVEQFRDFQTTPTLVLTRDYDAAGNLIREEVDETFGGRVFSYEYDVDGNEVRWEWDRGAEDRGVWTYAYDAAGNRIRSELDGGEPGDPDGTLNFVSESGYDADGNLVRVEWDRDADGATDEVRVQRYDASGNLMRVERDEDADGTPDIITSYHYDEVDQRAREEVDGDAGNPADGEPDLIVTLRYDAIGNLVMREMDSDADGTPERIDRWRYDYDADGNLTLYETEQEYGRSISTWEIGAGGRAVRFVVHEELAPPGNHPVSRDVTESYQYDPDGNLTRIESDQGSDGTPDSLVVIEHERTGWGYIFPD